MRHKADPNLDYDIIFKDDEEIHEGVKMQFSFLTQVPGGDAKEAGRGKKNQNEWRHIHARIPDEEWDARFEQLMFLNLIDVPEDYYIDNLYLSRPEELKAIFTKLEEDNLSYIQNQQESEQQLEYLSVAEEQAHNKLQHKHDSHTKARNEL